MSKSYVTIGICPICSEDLNMILMDRRFKERFEMKTVVPTEVCDKCREKYLTEGVLLINPETGTLVVLKDSAFRRMIDKPIPKDRIGFADEEILKVIIDHDKEAKKK